jgi:iron complex outermembrane recepter protein
VPITVADAGRDPRRDNSLRESYPFCDGARSLTPTTPSSRRAAVTQQLLEGGGALMRISIVAAAICLSIVGIAAADDAKGSIRKDVNIPAEGMGPALQGLAKVFDLQVLYRTEVVGQLRTQGAVGEFTPEDALKQVLKGSGLTYRYLDDKTITIMPASSISTAAGSAPTTSTSNPAGSPSDHTEKEGKKSSSDGFRVAQVDQGTPSSSSLVGRADQVSPKKPDQLAEVVVTAQKRESTVQNTPISMTAVSGLEIQNRGLTNLETLAQSVPGVSMRTSGPGQTEFEMRGMASTGGNSPTVGFYLDDTPLTAPAQSQNGRVVIDPNLYDLNRVEVLRGPQGTLYGSSSMGGTIKLVPNAPNVTALDMSAEFIPSYTDGGSFNHGENAMLNLPFAGGTAALRIVGSELYTSGWIDRIVIANGAFPLETNGKGVPDPTGTVRGNVLAAPVAADYKDSNHSDLTAVRASLLWQPTDGLAITPSFFHQRISQNALDDIDSNPGTDAHYQPFDEPEPFYDNFDLYSLNLRYDFKSFNLTSTASYWDRDEQLNQDSAEEWQWGLGLPSFYTSQGGIGPTNPVNEEDDKSKQFSEEVRLTSSGASAFQWLVGYFYADFESQWNSFWVAPGAIQVFGNSNLYTQIAPTKIIQQAAFGELSYQVLPQLKAAAGLRLYSYDESVHTAVSGIVSVTGTNSVANFATGENDHGANPKLDLSYEPTKDLLVYATAAKGFRPGGGTGPIPTSGALGATCEADLKSVFGTAAFVQSPVAFAPDNVWNYELGEKWRAYDGRLVFNSAVYFENWSGVQQQIPLGCGYPFTANAGDAHIYGTEAEMQAILAPGFIFSGSVGYTHATLVSVSLPGSGIIVGSTIQEVPEWTSSASLAYRHDIGHGLDYTARLESDYVSSRTDSTFYINQVPSYDLTYFRTGVEAEHWSAVLFANNVFNKRAVLNNVQQISVNLPTFNREAVSQPLTIGIDLIYRFR